MLKYEDNTPGSLLRRLGRANFEQFAIAKSDGLRASPRAAPRGAPRASRSDSAPTGRRVVANLWQNFSKISARFRLYRRRSLQVNTRFAAFFKIYQII